MCGLSFSRTIPRNRAIAGADKGTRNSRRIFIRSGGITHTASLKSISFHFAPNTSIAAGSDAKSKTPVPSLGCYRPRVVYRMKSGTAPLRFWREPAEHFQDDLANEQRSPRYGNRPSLTNSNTFSMRLRTRAAVFGFEVQICSNALTT